MTKALGVGGTCISCLSLALVIGINTMTKESYREYLQTDHWRAFRARVFADPRNKRCQICKRTRQLNIHHLTYERVGKELLADVIVLCKPCHFAHHDKIIPLDAVQWAKKRPSLGPLPKTSYQKLVAEYRKAQKTRDFTVSENLYVQCLVESYDYVTMRHIQSIGKQLEKYALRKARKKPPK